MQDQKLQIMIDKFKEDHPKKEIILIFQAGSHFFGLNDHNSDTDYRGLYIDSGQDCFSSSNKILQVCYKTNVSKGKNNKNDVDFNIFSITSFLKLLKIGDFNMMELLYVPENKILYKTPLFDELVVIRDRLLVNDISAFLGFIKKEYRTYGVNIYHYKMQEDFVKFLSRFPEMDRMSVHWAEISEYVGRTGGLKITNMKVNNSENTKLIPAIMIAQRLHGNTETVKHVVKTICSIVEKYGHRQRGVSENGQNFKGLYHALRLIFEAKDIFDHGTLIFPFSPMRHSLLKRVKEGNIDKDELFWIIDSEIAELTAREHSVVSNRSQVEYRIEKLEMAVKGRMSLIDTIKNHH
jgi:hypothetical protein